MTAWVLLLLMAGGPTTIDVPDEATCQRVLSELRRDRFGYVTGRCINREPRP